MLSSSARSVRAASGKLAVRPRLVAATPRIRSLRTMASLKVAVKGDPATNTLLDCPFCHRVLLTLETKQVPYEMDFIDFNNKPQWLLDKSGGKVPVIMEGDFMLPDSDEIVKYLEKQHPGTSMDSSVPGEVTAGFFPAFRGLLMCGAEELQAKKEAFIGEAKKVDTFLAGQSGPFFGGANLNATDAAFAPKLYHAIVALQHFKGWDFEKADVAGQFPALAKYWFGLQQLPAWKNTDYGKPAIIKGWERHMAQGH